MINKIIFLILIFFALFFPTKYYSIYHFVLLGGASLLILINGVKLNISFYARYFLILIVLIVFNVFVSSIYLGSDFFRNATEIFRFLPTLLFLLCYRAININRQNIYFLFCSYTSVVTIICCLQYLGFESVLNLSRIYGSELQVENSLIISSRAIGLSTGPGNNGAMFTILYVYFLSNFLFFKERKSINIIFMLLCAVSVVFAQSQTSLVAISLVTLFSLVILFIIDKRKVLNFYVFFVFFNVILGMGVIFYKFLNKFGYLISLFEEGLTRNSYKVRVEKMDAVLDLSFSNPIMFFFGYGKDLVPNATALDNEYAFYLGVYGAFSLMLLFVFYLYFLTSVFNKNKNFPDFLLCLTVFAGLIIAWPSSFTLDPRLLFIFTIYLIFSLREKNIQR